MDARTQRRLRREAVREVEYTEFVKERTREKNITDREKRMLRRRVLRDEYMKNEELMKKDKLRRKNSTEEDVLVSIPISDLREILQAKKDSHTAAMKANLPEFNYHMMKIEKICEKHLK